MLTDKDGKLAERYSYSVTGEVTIYDASGTEIENSALGNRWMYTGREWLPEIGLYDYRNRVYSAQLGRFLQTDPVKFYAGDLNLYRYLGNDFLNLSDPEGLATWGIRVSGTLAWFFGVNVTVGFYIDDQGGFDMITSVGGAASFNALLVPDASVTLGLNYTNAESVKDLHGMGVLAGVSAGAGPIAEVNVLSGNGYIGIDAGIGLGTPGVSVQAVGARSWSTIQGWDHTTNGVDWSRNSSSIDFSGYGEYL